MTWRKGLPLLAVLLAVAAFVATRAHEANDAGRPAADLRQQAQLPFRFVAFGDTRFTHSTSGRIANTQIRQAIVRAIANEKPAFISIGGDIVYRGDDSDDWDAWDAETRAWKDANLTVYPALGNHDLHGNQNTALANYFKRFPELNGSRYYSARIANCLVLVLDSALNETSGAQGEWFRHEVETMPNDVAFVLVVLHHPPYTSSSDAEKYGGGHSARSPEKDLAAFIEDRQAHTHARFVVFAGHVHNYERQQHGGVTYFVTGGGGAHPYPIERTPGDLFQSTDVNYHYLLGEVSAETMKVTMNRIEIKGGKEIWTQPDSVTISVPPK